MIGRIKEQDILRNAFESRRSEFVAVFGRRRIGKTYLIKEMFGDIFTFYATGILDKQGGMKAQLDNFNGEIANFGGAHLPVARDWRSAFSNLNKLVEQSGNKGKKVIFLDEVPWMATMHSDFLPALDYFWNRWASSRKDVLLIICGSATSWVIDNIVNDRGGLHNRLTKQIPLPPFSLKECEEYCRAEGIVMTRHQMVEAYMIFGGVPYYWSLMDPRYDLYHNVDQMYFAENAPLRNEYQNLYRSLFRNAGSHILVAEALAAKNKGLTRSEIIETTGLSNGGGLSSVLSQLEQCGFIRSYLSYGKKEQDKLYQLTDPFTVFHVRFRDGQNMWNDNYWLKYSLSPDHSSWSGFAFERVCLLHIPQIKQKLGVAGVMANVYAWQEKPGKGDPPGRRGAQIDLVLDRSDRVANACEIKYLDKEYEIDREEYMKLINRRAAFEKTVRKTVSVRTTIVTTFGVKRNRCAMEFPSVVVMDDLFT